MKLELEPSRNGDLQGWWVDAETVSELVDVVDGVVVDVHEEAAAVGEQDTAEAIGEKKGCPNSLSVLEGETHNGGRRWRRHGHDDDSPLRLCFPFPLRKGFPLPSTLS